MQVFDPAAYSLEELKFSRDRLGLPPAVALKDEIPTGVSANTVAGLLRAVYELEELRKHRGESWVGVEALQSSIDTFLREYQKWQGMHKRGAPRLPTMYAWDARGRPHKSGVGADSGQVRTWIDSEGKRHPLAVELKGIKDEEFVADWVKPQEPLPTDLIEDMENGNVACPVCKYSQVFKPDSPASYRMAKARISKHMKSSGVKDPIRHREAYTFIFGD